MSGRYALDWVIASEWLAVVVSSLQGGGWSAVRYGWSCREVSRSQKRWLMEGPGLALAGGGYLVS